MAASANSAVDVKALYAQALAQWRDGRADAALPMLGQIIAANPRVAEAHWLAAQIFADADEFPRALGHAEAAVRLRPSEPAVWITWADTVALSGVKEAERAFLAALREAGLPMPVKLRLQDRFGSQRAAARDAIQVHPGSRSGAGAASMAKPASPAWANMSSTSTTLAKPSCCSSEETAAAR